MSTHMIHSRNMSVCLVLELRERKGGCGDGGCIGEDGYHGMMVVLHCVYHCVCVCVCVCVKVDLKVSVRV
jgi:hypothetical protein